MSKCLSPFLIILGIACIIGGFLVPSVLKRYSQGYTRIAVRAAREPERFKNPSAQDDAINYALEGSNRLGDIIAIASVTFGAVAGGALIASAHLLAKSTDLNTKLIDAKTKLEARIAIRHEIKN